MIKNKNKSTRQASLQAGQTMLIIILILSAMGFMLGALLMYTGAEVVSHRNSVRKVQALNIAEAALEIAIWKLNNEGGYNGELDTAFGSGAFDISIDTIDSSTREITATSYIPNKSDPKVTRIISAQVTINANVISFNYGIQTGNGGLVMSGEQTKVSGNIYSNGNIEATTITGSAVSANLSAETADQVNDTPTTPSYDVTFADDTVTQDIAQSFQLSQSYSFNNIKFYIKKFGSPSNATVRILYDDNGSPGTAVSGLTGTLNASQVTSSYGWVTVSLPTTPILTAGQTYWFVIDASSSASKYFIIGANDNGYSNGVSKIGRDGGTWNDNSPSTADYYFQIYLGGQTSSITGGTIGTTTDDLAWAHEINDVTVSGPLYCEMGDSNNKTCDTSRDDPDPQDLPFSDGNIQDFKNEAVAGGEQGDVSINSDTSMGPTKISGDLTITGGAELTQTGTIWITGNVNLTGGGVIRLDESYGSNDGVIIIDGHASLGGNSEFYGSGTSDSYPFLITTSSCPDDPSCGNNDAISFGGGSGSVGLIAQNGTIDVTGGSALKTITAKTIEMSGGAELIYDSGLINSNFSSGPGASWEFARGTYIIIK